MIFIKRPIILSKSSSGVAAFVFVFLNVVSPSASAYFYQINSETINSPKTNTVQADLKLLLGFESEDLSLSQNFLTRYRASVGTYSFYQSANDPSYYLRNGFVAQVRTNLYLNNVFFQYEHHEFQSKNSISEAQKTTAFNWNSENRFGLIFFKFITLSQAFDSDTYFESFLIPEVSKNDLLSVLRSTLIYKFSSTSSIFPFAEIYLKQSPFLFGGDIRELRTGVQWRPSSSISVKLMANVLPPSSVSNTGILFQLNIYKEGVL